VLTFEKGSIKKNFNIGVKQKVHWPTVPFLPIRQRQANFNLPTYDRMRILTTELRRMVLDKNITSLELYFNPRAVLKKEALEQAFLWI
jgi:hypothetical protein